METEKKIGFLQEGVNKFSANRLIFVAGSFWNMCITTAMCFAFEGVTIPTLLVWFTGVQSALIAMKVSQKAIEKKD